MTEIGDGKTTFSSRLKEKRIKKGLVAVLLSVPGPVVRILIARTLKATRNGKSRGINETVDRRLRRLKTASHNLNDNSCTPMKIRSSIVTSADVLRVIEEARDAELCRNLDLFRDILSFSGKILWRSQMSPLSTLHFKPNCSGCAAYFLASTDGHGDYPITKTGQKTYSAGPRDYSKHKIIPTWPRRQKSA